MRVVNRILWLVAAIMTAFAGATPAVQAADEALWKIETRIGPDGKPFAVKVWSVPGKPFETYYPPAAVSNDPIGLAAIPPTTDESNGWYLPGFGYLPPWPHTLPRVKASERYMGYLVPSRGGYGIPNNAPPGGWSVPVTINSATTWYYVPRHLESPFLDAIDAHRLRWTYPPNWRSARPPAAGQQAQQPVIVPAVPTGTLPSPFPAVRPQDVPAVRKDLTRRDAASLRGDGTALLKADQPARALTLLTAATERDADDAAAWALRAVAERALGFAERATVSARRAAALEMTGHADAATVAKALETVQGPARQFLTTAGAALTLADAQALLARPAVTGLAAR